MIDRVAIKNFKSIRDLEFEAKRVNLFIGEPNTGKSNIVEALALISEGLFEPNIFKNVFRFRGVADLFCDQQITSPIEVTTNRLNCVLDFNNRAFRFRYSSADGAKGEFQTDQSGQHGSWTLLRSGIRFYLFKDNATIKNQTLGVLTPPHGDNLASIIYTNKDFRRRVSDLFRTRDFRLEIKPVEMELLLSKAVGDELYSFPYESVSQTWRRIIFYMAILETNRDSTLLLDEPEANTFPFYTKYLAERIALDESNQFFITTHNPYLLSSIVEKTPVKDLSVFVTRMEKFETKVKQVPDKNLPELLELNSDAFFNLDRLVGE